MLLIHPIYISTLFQSNHLRCMWALPTYLPKIATYWPGQMFPPERGNDQSRWHEKPTHVRRLTVGRRKTSSADILPYTCGPSKYSVVVAPPTTQLMPSYVTAIYLRIRSLKPPKIQTVPWTPCYERDTTPPNTLLPKPILVTCPSIFII